MLYESEDYNPAEPRKWALFLLGKRWRGKASVTLLRGEVEGCFSFTTCRLLQSYHELFGAKPRDSWSMDGHHNDVDRLGHGGRLGRMPLPLPSLLIGGRNMPVLHCSYGYPSRSDGSVVGKKGINNIER